MNRMVRLFLLLAWLCLLPWNATADDVDECLRCHGGDRDIMATADNPTPLRSVPRERYAQGVHGRMACRSCHVAIASLQPPHQPGKAEKLDCAACHQQRQQSGEAQVRRNIERYRQSFHARPNPDDPSIPNATCHECHDTHVFQLPADKRSPAYAAWRQTIPSLCGVCHDDQLERYNASIHGVALLQRNNFLAPTCTDCHTTHDITGSHIPAFLLDSPKSCGQACHPRNLASYLRFYHGQATQLGHTDAAKCFHCHDSHRILAVKDPASTVHPANRLKSCQKCHDGRKRPLATAGFASFTPHAQPDDAERHPQLWLVARLIRGLLWGVMIFFLTHSALWFYREWREGRDRPDAPAELPMRHVIRFSPVWRLAHLLFVLSVMALILTGMTLLDAHAPWAPLVARWLGGPHLLGSIHRAAALVMVSIFLFHLLLLLPRLVRDRRFAWFGPDSLLPNRQDLRDCRDMFLWFFGKGEKPRFDRWTYYEKFDYWAVFWGMALIGGSGAILAWPQVAGEHFEGWIFNVALLLHGEEAFLAVVFLFTIHFFNNHFRPEKLPPPEIVIFTGTQTLEALQRDHPAHIDRLKASGELERLTVPSPSPLRVRGAKVLGLLLILVGLGLLGLTLHGAVTAPRPALTIVTPLSLPETPDEKTKSMDRGV
ncbi:MAG: cytochrome C [Magnetococcales bacterium]|nr:cytochrome C [Magnetococcales bacterium]